jgi:hypothetical protein
MAVVFSGEEGLSNLIFKAPELFTLKLYRTSVTPEETSVAGSFTEANFSGYTAKALTTDDWSVSGSTATLDEQTFTHSGGGTNNLIYGWYIVGTTSNTLFWAEKLNAPVPMNSIGDQIKFVVALSLD